MTRHAPDLLSELAAPLTTQERALGGCARLPLHGPDLETAMAVWDLLAYVLGADYVPRPAVVIRWQAADRAQARRWGERELARRVIGVTGCPSVEVPAVLVRYVERAWAASLARTEAGL